MKPLRNGTKETRSHWHPSFHSHRPIIAVDFDHTITKNCSACPDWKGEFILQEGVKDSLTELNKTFDIVILSGGGNYVEDYETIIKDFLVKHGVPFDKIEVKKPPAVFLIDDRAVHHKGWKRTINEIKKRMKRGRNYE